MIKLQSKSKEKGFTIIELVVVILLLGILTATALPRFMDVQNQAHDAVVTGVLGGMITSSALFHAQWYAEGQPLTVVDYDGMRAGTAGYALGALAGTKPTMADSTDCQDIYNSFLQPVGRPSLGLKTAANSAPTRVAGHTEDFVAYLNNSDSTTKKQCYFIYTGQYDNATTYDIPVILYNGITGVLSLSTPL